MNQLYSEASLGKAFLNTMNIKPWRAMQPDFPREVIGQIMSSYYGGRAEVHIRREITPVIHCDFRSMYPTVCTLMGLWQFVIAQGTNARDDTDAVRAMVNTWTLDDLRMPENWGRLTCLVQVRPDDDIFPVRAVYEKEQSATIGLNRLSSDEPMWFTLPDVLASKFLSGKMPKVLSAIRFEAGEPQVGLKSIKLEGIAVDPAKDDFYKLLIDQRGRVQALEDQASEFEKPGLKSASQSLKILANSTSYGIFIELNVKGLEKPKSVTCYDFRGVGRKVMARKMEDAGQFFHPLLATLITGAARLMLALAERNTLDQGLDWAFCDTDSLAIAKPATLDTPDFISRVEAVRVWFEPLNPYDKKGSILQLEKVNFPIGGKSDPATVAPVHCLAISAKRYVLFNRDANDMPIIRKASAHGLGQYVPPYTDAKRGERIGRISVELWQEDLWREIIRAFDRGKPDQVDLENLPNFDQPAASRYAATNLTLLNWFKAYNEAVSPNDRIRPFNFLLSFQAKSKLEIAAVDHDALNDPLWRKRIPHPASRYSSDLANDQPRAFDRKTGEPVPWHWLKTMGRALTRHHMHSETKFRGGFDDERGILRRRHVKVLAAIAIGKEADNLEIREFLGDEGDDTVEWELAGHDWKQILADIEDVLESCNISDTKLWRRAAVSHHTLADLREGKRVEARSLLNLARAADELGQEAIKKVEGNAEIRELGLQLAEKFGSVAKLAEKLGLSRQYLGRMMKGQRPFTSQVERLLRIM